MSPTLPARPARPARVGCKACPGDENTSPRTDQSTPLLNRGSATVGRTLGRRSLDAFSSIRGSLKGHPRALKTTTNQTPGVTSALACESADASPVEPAKQKWYDSLRGKTSQIPLPSTSPVSMSSTLKCTRTRFFRSPTAQLPPPVLSPKAQQTLGTALPKLELASFQADLRRMSLFGEATEKSFVEEDLKAHTRHHSPKKACRVQAEMASDTEPKSPETAANQQVADSPGPKTPPHMPSLEISKKIDAPSGYQYVDGRLVMEPWRILCDLYYKGTPAEPEHKQGFPTATDALSHFALRHMLSESHDCSPTLLWTGDRRETATGKHRVNQAFNVYPMIDGPRRIELAKQPVNLHWAIITFTNGPVTVKSTDLVWEDKRMMKAVRNILNMGYHVDVWTSYDDNGWGFDVAAAEAEHRVVVKEKAPRTHRTSVFSSPDYLEHRQRYEACMRHGLAGFNQEELAHLDTLQKEFLHANEDNFVLVGVNSEQVDEVAATPVAADSITVMSQDPAVPETTELMGYLEHMEESITEDQW